MFRRSDVFNRIFSHHVVDGDVFADVANKFEERKILHPVVVIHQFGGIGCIRFKIEKARQLSLNAILIMA